LTETLRITPLVKLALIISDFALGLVTTNIYSFGFCGKYVQIPVFAGRMAFVLRVFMA
jgi:hypothetical protein